MPFCLEWKGVIAMNNLLAGMLAGLLLLAMNGVAVAQEEPSMTPKDAKQDTQTDPKAQPVQPADATVTDEQYFAALKKCESLSASEKTKCLEAAKKKFGQM
jgi:hypothetical protein